MIGRSFRFLVRWVWRTVLVCAAVFAALYGITLGTLGDLDRADPLAAEPPISQIQKAALFVTSQVLPLRQPRIASAIEARVFRDCDACPELVELPSGYYLMGSHLFEMDRYAHIWERRPYRKQLKFANREGPRRLVHIARPFAMTRYELTFAEWEAAQDDPDWERITGRAPRKPDFGTSDYLSRAVSQIDWYDGKAIAAWLSAKTGQTYRLPTEAEWEYAARAGSVTAYPWGNDIGLNNAACVGCSTIWTEARIGPVGLHPPNAFGLYDMIGNGWEWVEDCFAPWQDAVKTSAAAHRFEGCEFVVFKGGTAVAEGWQARSSMRVGPHPNNAGEGSTIRLVREIADE
ncbi:MAG: SUMF1/EgtB/PvdO family nonheme iron enzyme [Albidovulum sp.]